MSKYEEHFKAFLKVRDALKMSGALGAYALCYHKPVKFYGEHSFEEAIKILKAEAEGKDAPDRKSHNPI